MFDCLFNFGDERAKLLMECRGYEEHNNKNEKRYSCQTRFFVFQAQSSPNELLDTNYYNFIKEIFI